MLPRRADIGSCAYDFYSPIDVIIPPNCQVIIWTDIKAYMQPNEVLILNVRSSQGKLRVQLANTQGWIDSTYYNNSDNEGNIGIFLRNEGTKDYVINAGDKICQGMFINYLITDDDDPILQNRLGGFGSTGVK
jgi:dUTP pyrophosphatase